jgi:hypothetical protein
LLLVPVKKQPEGSVGGLFLELGRGPRNVDPVSEPERQGRGQTVDFGCSATAGEYFRTSLAILNWLIPSGEPLALDSDPHHCQTDFLNDTRQSVLLTPNKSDLY